MSFCTYCQWEDGHAPTCPTRIPWAEMTASHRLPPRECVGAARDALNRAYGLASVAQVPVLVEAVDWLRRALEQMAPETGGES